MVTSRNGLTQRAELALRRAGRSIRTAVVTSEADMDTAVAPRDFDLVICPYLTHRIPARIYNGDQPVVIIHPGPPGDRGPSSLDWALTDLESPTATHTNRWGVTAIGAVEEMDAGPIWAWRTFRLDPESTKSAAYNTVVADAAIEVICEVADRALDSGFAPVDQATAPRPIPGVRARRPMRQPDRAFSWNDDARAILRRIRTADGSPGVLATVAGQHFYLHDAHLALPRRRTALPGAIVSRHEHAVEIACGAGGSIWIGHLRPRPLDEPTHKGPAARVLARAGISLADVPVHPDHAPTGDITYSLVDGTPTITLDTYNGTLTTEQCRRLAEHIDHAAEQPGTALVLRGAGPYFCTGLHLGAIELADIPFHEGLANIRAINRVCRALLESPRTVIAAITGNAAAGGMMLALCADVIAARERAVVNPHYRLGLTGSELHTLMLPRRVGLATATRLLRDRETLDTHTARALGLIDHIGPNAADEFDRWLAGLTYAYTDRGHHADRPAARDVISRSTIDLIEQDELDQMVIDLSSQAFAQARRAFLLHEPEPETADARTEEVA